MKSEASIPSIILSSYPKASANSYLNTDTRLKLDPFQQALSNRLDSLSLKIQKDHKSKSSIRVLVGRLLGLSRPMQRGLYIWGGVGRGKTMLMDRFYESLPFASKQRWHFHQFMQDVHETLAEVAGSSNPLETVAEGIHQEASVLCLDEFFVSDIGDAMILSELLHALFDRQVFLVTTSNIAPKMLYENGLQRRRFLPAIELIEEHMDVVSLGGEVDYRLITLRNRDLYRVGTSGTQKLIEDDRAALVDTSHLLSEPMVVNRRSIESLYRGEGVVAFRFADLCEGPRSASDYIEIARIHHTVVIYDVPELTQTKEEATKRFINAIDVFYDRNVNLVLHAHKPLESLYIGSRYTDEFQRTRSRIAEMSSTEYLTRAHRA